MFICFGFKSVETKQRHDEHFHKLSQRVYTNDYPQTMSSRTLSDNQVVTRSQTRNNTRNLESNKPVTGKNSPEQRNTTDKNPSQPSNVPRRGILEKNEQPLRMPSQE